MLGNCDENQKKTMHAIIKKFGRKDKKDEVITMLTTVQVRNDLKEIRYYYSMKELFDRSSKTVKPLAIVQKVERYNTAMQNAPARLYILYVSLYIDNNTQAVLAEEWQLTADYMKELNNKLIYFLQSALK